MLSSFNMNKFIKAYLKYQVPSRMYIQDQTSMQIDLVVGLKTFMYIYVITSSVEL